MVFPHVSSRFSPTQVNPFSSPGMCRPSRCRARIASHKSLGSESREMLAVQLGGRWVQHGIHGVISLILDKIWTCCLNIFKREFPGRYRQTFMMS